MSEKSVVLVIRDPDYSNEYTVDGDVEFIDIDLGSAFDGPKGFRAMDPGEQQEYIDMWRDEVKHLPPESPVRQRVETLIQQITEP